MAHKIIDWPAELDKARKQDPAIVPHLEAIRAAWLAIHETPLPSHPKAETVLYQTVVPIRRRLLAQAAAGRAVAITSFKGGE
jgi:hypothetical protein